MSRKQSVARKTIPLCGIVLVLGTMGCDWFQRPATDAGTIYAFANADQKQLIELIQEFLKDVPRNEGATFDRFFADDIIYARGTGQVITKKDILADTGNSTAPRANATYEGEDFQVHQYGDLAVVNFRLVCTQPRTTDR